MFWVQRRVFRGGVGVIWGWVWVAFYGEVGSFWLVEVGGAWRTSGREVKVRWSMEGRNRRVNWDWELEGKRSKLSNECEDSKCGEKKREEWLLVLSFAASRRMSANPNQKTFFILKKMNKDGFLFTPVVEISSQITKMPLHNAYKDGPRRPS